MNKFPNFIRFSLTLTLDLTLSLCHSSNQPSLPAPSVKNSSPSPPCSFSFYSTTPFYVIPRTSSWLLPKSQELKSYPSSRHMSICQQPLDSPLCIPNCVIEWNNEMCFMLVLFPFCSSFWHLHSSSSPMWICCILISLLIKLQVGCRRDLERP